MSQLLSGYRFGVRVGPSLIGFSLVSGISKSMEVERYQEGGRNDSPHIFPKQATSGGTMTMKKGVYKGKEPLFILVGNYIPLLGIEVYDATGKQTIKYYNLINCLITKWEIGEMDAQSNALLIESFEVAYEQLEVL